LIDAGANIGSTTVAFLREGVFQRAIAVEPERRNFQLLEHNVRQNGFAGRVRCHPVALGGASGSVELEVAADNFGDHRVRVRATPGAYGESDRRTQTVPITRLDDLLDEQGPFAPSSVGLLWIDVQGYEGHVLAGAERLLAGGVPVEMELWPYGLERAGTSRDALLAALATSFRRVIDLRDPSPRAQPIEALEGIYARLAGPTADTEVLLFA
jgi:FkbM family methyltransferase